MKKFWTLLVLLAVALNFSSSGLWAQEVKEQAVAAVTEDVKKEASDEETALENAAAADDETVTAEGVTVVKPTADATKAVVPDTTQTKEKIS